MYLNYSNIVETDFVCLCIPRARYALGLKPIISFDDMIKKFHFFSGATIFY